MVVSVPKREPTRRFKSTAPTFTLTGKVLVPVMRSMSSGRLVRGVWVEDPRLQLDVWMNIQPMKGHELMTLPEGDRSKDCIKVYSAEPLKTIEEAARHGADIIIWNEKRYVATKTFPYEMGVLNHTKVVCVRLPETPDNIAEAGDYVRP